MKLFNEYEKKRGTEEGVKRKYDGKICTLRDDVKLTERS